MSEQPVYAVPGQLWVPGMINPEGKSYGHVKIRNEDVDIRLVNVGSGGILPSEGDYNYFITQGITYFVVEGLAPNTHPGGKFLGHDGLLYDDHVNQIFHGRDWIKACGTLASHIAEFRDHYHMLRQPGTYGSGHDFEHTDESSLRNKVTLWWGRGLCGYAYKLVKEWMDLPVLPDPNAHADLNWRVGEAFVAEKMEIICENCLGFNILRRFHRRCRPLDWQTSLNGGILTVPEFSDEVWSPRAIMMNFAAQSRTARGEQWDDLVEWYGKALDYHDENIAVERDHA